MCTGDAVARTSSKSSRVQEKTNIHFFRQIGYETNELPVERGRRRGSSGWWDPAQIGMLDRSNVAPIPSGRQGRRLRLQMRAREELSYALMYTPSLFDKGQAIRDNL